MSHGSLSSFLQLFELPLVSMKQMAAESIVDYTKSIIMMGDDYIKSMEEKSACKKVVEKEKNLKRKEVGLTKGREAEEKDT